MNVPQFTPWIGKSEYREIAECFQTTWITEGPKSAAFKDELLKLSGARYGVLAPNGTLALFLGLKALGIGHGDEVLVPDFSFIASATAVEMCGGIPVFVDVNRENFQINLLSAKRLIGKKTKAIMPVHIYGTVCAMDEVMNFAKLYGLLVIEDAAQALNVRYKQQHAGTFGNVGCFSFFADKTITTGEGGFVVTAQEKIYNKLLYLRNQGRLTSGTFKHPHLGYNLRLTDIQAAIGLAQLKKLGRITSRKLRILNLYQKLLSDISQITMFIPPKDAEWLPFRIPIIAQHAHILMEFMRNHGVEPRTFFYPLHRQPAFRYLRTKNTLRLSDKDFSGAVFGYKHGICLPTFPTLTYQQIKYVVKIIRNFYQTFNG